MPRPHRCPDGLHLAQNGWHDHADWFPPPARRGAVTGVRGP